MLGTDLLANVIFELVQFNLRVLWVDSTTHGHGDPEAKGD